MNVFGKPIHGALRPRPIGELHQGIIVACRSARESLSPGAVVGRCCALCSEPLQVSEETRRRLEVTDAAKVHFLCGKCALRVVRERERRGQRVDVEVHSKLDQRLAAGPFADPTSNEIAAWIRRKREES